MRNLLIAFLLFFLCISCNETHSNISQKIAVAKPVGTLVADSTWTTKILRSKAEWKRLLTDQQYLITRQKGTEPAFSNSYDDNKDAGIYYCVNCSNALFTSSAKFDSGTGWPCFNAPYASSSVAVAEDNSEGILREEIICRRCDAHLGHLFDDGPEPTGERYCLNGTALVFQKEDLHMHMSKATFAGGRFWKEEPIFESLKGVKEVVCGYAGGFKDNPNYAEVLKGITGHAETVTVYYDSSKIDYPTLLKVYFNSLEYISNNETTDSVNNPVRSIIFYNNDQEKQLAIVYKAELKLNTNYLFEKDVALWPLKKFWQAETVHQNYMHENPTSVYINKETLPKLKQNQQKFASLIKPEKWIR